MFAHLCFAMPQKYSFFALINKRSMKITVILNGKTEEDYLLVGISAYEKRLKHYIPFETIVIPALKNTKALSIEQQKEKEGELLFKEIQSTDRLILLDEGGKEYNSVDFSGFLQQQMNTGIKNLVFVVGGPYGFSDDVYKRANGKISLSRMTFSHQMVRLFFVEQLYRGMTILKNEPYHHQ
jgi:23S rRNA (pseudouridine1915-N3)-methyltransferase